MDTLRADSLGCYGATTGVSPRIDRLAAAGTLFENTFSQVPLTLPSHATIMTGLYPPEHGIRYHGGFRLSAAETTIAEVLLKEGERDRVKWLLNRVLEIDPANREAKTRLAELKSAEAGSPK